MRAVGIILAGGNSNKMKELTHRRAVAAMPIAGSYRAIDFALSNHVQFACAESCRADSVQARSLRASEFLQMVEFRKKARRSVCIYAYHYT